MTLLTLTYIARSLGLSVTTVSRALGGFDDVAPATRARVEAEAARIGYHPNVASRRVRRGRAETVGLVLPTTPGQFDDPFFFRLLTGLSLHLAARALDLLVTAAAPGSAELEACRRLVEANRVDAFILARTRRQDMRVSYLLDRGFPFVVHGRTEEARPFSFLDVDGSAAFALATRRLLGFGHRTIGMVNAPASFSFAGHRAAGWRGALAEAGLAPGPYREVAATEAGGFAALRDILDHPAPPTAVLCATDRLAVGALAAISAAGLRAGRDISVIGFDNLPSGAVADPPLTTLDQQVDSATARLVAMLTDVLGGAAPSGEIWQAALVARQSDGPAPTAEKPAPERAREVTTDPKGEDHAEAAAPG